MHSDVAAAGIPVSDVVYVSARVAALSVVVAFLGIGLL